MVFIMRKEKTNMLILQNFYHDLGLRSGLKNLLTLLAKLY